MNFKIAHARKPSLRAQEPCLPVRVRLMTVRLPGTRVQLCWTPNARKKEASMPVILWLLGVPLSLILVLWLVGVF